MNYQKMTGILVLGLMCIACEPSLQKAPRVPRSIAGDWVAEADNIKVIEDQLHAALDGAQKKELHKVLKRSSRYRATDQEGGDDMHPAPYKWEMSDQHEQHQALFDTVRPMPELKIEQAPGEIVLKAADIAQRSFEPGTSSTLVTTFASLHVTAGWREEDFIIYSKDSKTGLNIIERYRLLPDEKMLLSVTLSARYMDTQQYALLYHKRRMK